MTLTITPLTPALGATVDGLSLADELPPSTITALEAALVQHQVLFFRNQPVTPQEQSRFAARFGKLHVHPLYPVLPELPEIMLLDTHKDFPPDSDNWHTDVTFSQTPPLGAVLAAKQLPTVGGDTLWTSGAAAYEALSEPFRRFLEGLTAEHSIARSFPAERWAADPEGKAKYEAALAKYPVVTHPVVRTHPVSGRKGLFVNDGFTTRIKELSPRESADILAFLAAHVARPEFSVRWHWQVNDVAFWDNRLTQHYAVADYLPQRRIMHRATVIGDRPY
ncbi:MAG TPA: taurine dioxygenase [Candidatus Aquabacterium excrementipullorum]|nr:taurine dioxygenase [Candidatus Aquabacterium excrementipullorum]